jgi:hypothetical protein
MFSFLFFSFLTFISFITCCPNGSIPSLSDPSKCYFFLTQKTNWIVADQDCKNIDGNLVSIHNAFDNVFLSGEASDIFTDSASVDFWIGANNLLIPGTWSWVDQTPFDWNDWDISQPQNTSNTNCGSMLMKSERWIASDCMNQKPYVCLTEVKELSTTTSVLTTTTTKPLTCLEDWTYFNYTGACYKVFNTATWIDAEERCKVDGAHLASIHSLEENIFLANLAYYPGANVCDGGKQALFGLFTDDAKGHWKYTDGTPYDYSNWWKGITYSLTDAAYGYMHVAPVCNSPTGVFEFGTDFQWVVAKYICKMFPSKT